MADKVVEQSQTLERDATYLILVGTELGVDQGPRIKLGVSSRTSKDHSSQSRSFRQT